MKKRGSIITVSFRDDDAQLLNWVVEQLQKKRHKLNSVSEVIRKCIRITMDKEKKDANSK